MRIINMQINLTHDTDPINRPIPRAREASVTFEMQLTPHGVSVFERLALKAHGMTPEEIERLMVLRDRARKESMS